MIHHGTAPGKSHAAGAIAEVTLTDGDGALVRTSSSAQWKKADEDMELPAGAEAKTDKDSKIELQFSDNSILRINALSYVKLEAPDDSSKKIKANSGQMYFHLKKMSGGAKFEVETPTVIAGVRGTTFFVDVDEAGGEDAISVEDGEVEVRRGDRKVMLRKRMRARIARGDIEAPAEFDPEKMKRWEKWTEKKVAARFDQMQQEIAEHKEKSKALVADGKAVMTDAVRILKQTRESAAMLKKAKDRLERLEKQAGNTGGGDKPKGRKQKDSARPAKPGRGGKGGGETAPANNAGRIEKLLEEADDIEKDIDAALKQFAGLQDEIADLIARSKKLRDDAAALRESRERFGRTMDKQRRRREFDPQWKNLKGTADKISEHQKGAGENFAAVEETLTGKALESRNKGRNLIERIEEFSEEIKNEMDDLAETKKRLDDVRATLNAALN